MQETPIIMQEDDTMSQMTEAQLEDAESIIELMKYRLGDEPEKWYPTIEELESRITGKDKHDALFLMWLTASAGELTEEQKLVKKHAHKMLYRPEILTIVE